MYYEYFIAIANHKVIHLHDIVIIKEIIILYSTYRAQKLNFQDVLKVGQIFNVSVWYCLRLTAASTTTKFMIFQLT